MLLFYYVGEIFVFVCEARGMEESMKIRKVLLCSFMCTFTCLSSIITTSANSSLERSEPTILSQSITFDFDITSEEKQEIKKTVNGKEITLIVEDVPEIRTYSNLPGIFDLPLGNFNKKFTMSEGAPFLEMSAQFKGNVGTSKSQVYSVSDPIFNSFLVFNLTSIRTATSQSGTTGIGDVYATYSLIGFGTYNSRLRLTVAAGGRSTLNITPV